MLKAVTLTLALTTTALAQTPTTTPANNAAAVKAAATPINADERNYNDVLDIVGDAKVVLLGEASHGTHEFYQARADITRRLITEKGFDAVIIEGDWPDAQRVNRFVRGESGDRNADQALSGFQRFPRWMWRNTVVKDFVTWLREYNQNQPPTEKVGFYGMDLYNLPIALEEAVRYLERTDPAAGARARERYQCLTRYGHDLQQYTIALATGTGQSCQRNLNEQLRDVQRLNPPGATPSERDARFNFERNTALVQHAEAYYRASATNDVNTWNLRDTYMFNTVEAIRKHLGPDAKIAIWAHNSHVGDARATQMGQQGELNVGQLLRERYGDDARLIGFTTHTGTVTATTNWDETAQLKRVQPSLPGSYERLFHDTGLPRFLLDLRTLKPGTLDAPRLNRAIGVIYRPETERQSHYFQSDLTGQFDAVLHFDETRAVEPLEKVPSWTLQEW